MVFSSHIFLFYFLPLVLLTYFAMPRRGRNVLLTLLSYLFYGWANPFFVVLMASSTVIDYFCGLVISRQWGRSWSTPVARRHGPVHPKLIASSELIIPTPRVRS